MKLTNGYVSLVLTSLAGCLAASGCKGKTTATSESGQPHASASANTSGVANSVVDPQEVQAAVNPKKEAPYSGPAGTVRGIVRVRGGSAPTLDDVLRKIPDRCEAARRMYTRKFREGQGRTLADVVVGVTGYKGFVPARSDKIVVNASGCAFDARAIAMTFGQHLEVFNRDADTYIPILVGADTRPGMLLVAMPGGGPVKFTPTKVGEYGLLDRTHEYALANIFVLRYATTDVTDLDGKFEIDRVPAGDVQVSAYSPYIGQTVQQKATVPPGGSVEVNFEIPFETPKDAGAPK